VPRTRWGRAIAAVLLCAAIGSDPTAAFFLPLLVVRLWARPWRDSVWQVAGVLLGAAYQGIGVLRGAGATRVGHTLYDPVYAETSFRKGVLAHALASSHELSFIGIGSTADAEVLGVVMLALIAALGAWLARPQWLMAGICALFSLGFNSILVMQGGGADPRYITVPVLLMICAAVFLATPVPSGTPLRAAEWRAASLVPATVLCIAVGLNFVASYPGGSAKRGAAPSWSSQVHAGREACLHTDVHEAVLQNAPGGPNWTIDVPCSVLLGR
jgi:hypothetical protein